MSKDQQHDPGEHDPLRRLLRGLPKSEASPDFELRLHKRIRESSGAPERSGDRSPERRRFAIPAFAYSLLTVLAVGLISYYAFLDTPESPPATDSAPPAGADAQKAAPPASTAVPEASAPSKSDDVQESAPTSGRETAPAGQGPSADAPPKRAARQIPQTKAEEQPAVEHRQEASTPPPPPVTPKDEEAAGIAAPSAADPRQNLQQQQKEIGLPDAGRTPIFGPSPAPLSRGLAPAQRPMLNIAPELLDTAVSKDSVAKDSLDRLKSRMPGMRTPRVRKPNG